VVPDSALPTRLGIIGKTITDCNTATQPGWYQAPGGAVSNGPTTEWFHMMVSVMNDPANLRQIAYHYSSDTVWMRRRQDATWYAWQQIFPTAKHCATYGAANTISGGVWTPVYPTAYPPYTGNYMIEYGIVTDQLEAYPAAYGLHNGSGIVHASNVFGS
jgi:hypothetical protein